MPYFFYRATPAAAPELRGRRKIGRHDGIPARGCGKDLLGEMRPGAPTRPAWLAPTPARRPPVSGGPRNVQPTPSGIMGRHPGKHLAAQRTSFLHQPNLQDEASGIFKKKKKIVPANFPNKVNQ